MQLTQERQAGRGLPFEQYQDNREIRGLDSPVERLGIFQKLPVADAPFAYQQNESGCLR
jgi:hypothetical protein